MSPQPRTASPYLPLALAVVLVSTGSILARLAQAPPIALAFYRMALAALILLPFAGRSAWRGAGELSCGQMGLLAASALALGLHFATWIASLSRTTVAASVLLVNTTPFFAAFLAHVFLGERTPRRVLAALPLAFLGAALIALGDWKGGAGSLVGLALALAGAAAIAVHHVIGRGLRQALPLNAYVWAVWTGAALALLALGLATGSPFQGFPPRTWACLALLALVPTLGGHGLVNAALRRLPAPTVGLFLLGEPLGAALLAWLILKEVPSPLTLLGGAVVLGALGVAAWDRQGVPQAQ